MKKNYLHGILVALLICCSLVSISCANGLNSKPTIGPAHNPDPNDYQNHEYSIALVPISENCKGVTDISQVQGIAWNPLADSFVEASCSKLVRVNLSNGGVVHYLMIDKIENVGKAIHTFLYNAGYQVGLPNEYQIQNMIPTVIAGAKTNPSLDIEVKKAMNDFNYSVLFVTVPGDYNSTTGQVLAVSGALVNIKK